MLRAFALRVWNSIASAFRNATVSSRELIPQWTLSGPRRPSRLVFIDETWAKTNMPRLYGWMPRGKRPEQDPAQPLEDCNVLRRLCVTTARCALLSKARLSRHRARRRCDPRQSWLAQRQSRPAGDPSRRCGLLFMPKSSLGLDTIEQLFAKLGQTQRPSTQARHMHMRRRPQRVRPKSQAFSYQRMRTNPGSRAIVKPIAKDSNSRRIKNLECAPTRNVAFTVN